MAVRSIEGGGRLRAVGVGAGLTLTALALSTVMGVLVAVPLFVVGLDVESSVVLVSLVVGGQVGFLVVGYLYARRYDLAVPVSRPGRRDVGYVVVGVASALAFATLAGAVLARLGLMPEAVLDALLSSNPTAAIWLALLSVVVIAPAEEYLFRGVVQGRLRRTFGAPAAILLASLLFGSLHLGNFVGSPGAVVGWALLIAGVGVVFGVLYERTGNLVVPIAAHGVYNAVLFTVGYLML